MSEAQEDPPAVQRMRKALEAASEAATRMQLGKVMPDPGEQRDIRELDEIRRQCEAALTDLANWIQGEHAATRIADAVKESTTTLVSALGGAFTDRTVRAFPADAAVLAEGEFLKAQLTGVEGTEGRSPLFKDASIAVGASGFEVLADAVKVTSP